MIGCFSFFVAFFSYQHSVEKQEQQLQQHELQQQKKKNGSVI